MLTDQQRLYFDTFGFLVRRQVFTPQEMAVIGQRFDEVRDVTLITSQARADRVGIYGDMQNALSAPVRRGFEDTGV